MHSTSSNMHRKPGFPVANCSIKMPDSLGHQDTASLEDDNEQQQRRQQLINFGHSQWGFNNWSWAVTKQELDFVELTSGKYCAGVVAFVSVTVKSLDILRENIGYATSNANSKGLAIYKSRKCAVTNALRETLLSFGGSVATELLDLHEPTKTEPTPAQPEPENNQNLANKPTEPKNIVTNKIRKEVESIASLRSTPVKNPPVANSASNAIPNLPVPPSVIREPPIAKAHPMPANLPPPANRVPVTSVPRPPPAPAPRPNSNEAKPDPEEEARAERKRRQRLAQEEFRLKQLMKNGTDDKQDSKHCSSFDKLLAEIPTQDIVIEETGDSVQREGKRKSPAPECTAKRRASVSKLDIVQTE